MNVVKPILIIYVANTVDVECGAGLIEKFKNNRSKHLSAN